MTCKFCHESTPQNRRDGFCSDLCEERWTISNASSRWAKGYAAGRESQRAELEWLRSENERMRKNDT